MSKIVAYDASPDMWTLILVCADCGTTDDGMPLYEGEEWGGQTPLCEQCGGEIRGLKEVMP